MYPVKVRIERADDPKPAELSGVTFDYPEVGKKFLVATNNTFMWGAGGNSYDFGKVLNMKPLGDLILIQTDLAVAEVWLGRDSDSNEFEHIPESSKKVIPFVRRKNPEESL